MTEAVSHAPRLTFRHYSMLRHLCLRSGSCPQGIGDITIRQLLEAGLVSCDRAARPSAGAALTLTDRGAEVLKALET